MRRLVSSSARSCAVLTAVAIVAATGTLGVLWVPSMALMASGADRIGLHQCFAAAYFSLAWPAGGGALGQAAGDGVVSTRRARALRSPA